MATPRALPFMLRRGRDVIGADGITSTKETVHGLLRMDGERLLIQWRLHRSTDRIGNEIRTDEEVEPVREVALPLSHLASATVRKPWWGLGRVTRLVLTAADLDAFEAVTGADGLQQAHPAQLVLRIRPDDRLASREFAIELELAIGEHAMRVAAGRDSAPGVAIPRTRSRATLDP